LNTIVTQTFDNFGINYVIKKHQNEVFTCEDAARERGVALSQILKCMVGKDTAGIIHVMLIPGDKTLKIKKVRSIAGSIKIDLIPPKQLSEEFGLTVGAISPIQFLGKAKFYLDQTVLREKEIDISSGSPDAGVELKTEDLVDLIEPMICDIISSNS
jgi:Cys-tRNA(Pro) deacylase